MTNESYHRRSAAGTFNAAHSYRGRFDVLIPVLDKSIGAKKHTVVDGVCGELDLRKTPNFTR